MTQLVKFYQVARLHGQSWQEQLWLPESWRKPLPGKVTFSEHMWARHSLLMWLGWRACLRDSHLTRELAEPVVRTTVEHWKMGLEAPAVEGAK